MTRFRVPTMRRSLLTATVFAVFVAAPTPTLAAPLIATGTYDSSAGVFVVPIEITGAQALINWQFDLFFDPTDFQINTGCDAFADPFCDLLFGPITEGPFTTGPFSLFIPGVIDNVGGALTIVAGGSGDAQGSSGDGTLAFVEFMRIGSGDSRIRVGNVSAVSVPEPATWLLLVGGLAFTRRRASVRAG